MSELRPAAALPHCTLPSDSSRTIPSLPPFVPGAVNRADWACSHIAGSRGPLPWVLQGQVMGAGALRVGLCWAAWPESELTRDARHLGFLQVTLLTKKKKWSFKTFKMCNIAYLNSYSLKMYMTNMCPPCSSGIIIYTREVSVVLPGP